VPERDQLAGQVPDVDALATAVRLASVGQQRDPQRPAAIGSPQNVAHSLSPLS
jgi:hypothetical protein